MYIILFDFFKINAFFYNICEYELIV